jgi:hypothetical protein
MSNILYNQNIGLKLKKNLKRYICICAAFLYLFLKCTTSKMPVLKKYSSFLSNELNKKPYLK